VMNKVSHVRKVVRSSLPRVNRNNAVLVKRVKSNPLKVKSNARLAKKVRNNRKKTKLTKKMKVSLNRKAKIVNQQNAPKMVMITSNNNKIQILMATNPTTLSSWVAPQQPQQLASTMMVTFRATKVMTSTNTLAFT
jgi:hypothetical protein